EHLLRERTSPSEKPPQVSAGRHELGQHARRRWPGLAFLARTQAHFPVLGKQRTPSCACRLPPRSRLVPPLAGLASQVPRQQTSGPVIQRLPKWLGPQTSRRPQAVFVDDLPWTNGSKQLERGLRQEIPEKAHTRPHAGTSETDPRRLPRFHGRPSPPRPVR